MNRQVKFVTATANENLLLNTKIKAKIEEDLGLSDSDYMALFEPNPVSGEIQGLTIGFDIIFNSDNTFSINGKLAEDLIEQTAYSSTSIGKVYSISVTNIGSGVFIYYFQ